MSDAPNAELRRLRDEVSRLKAMNQRLEFEKVQQNQKLDAGEAARKILEGQLLVLFEQIGAIEKTNSNGQDRHKDECTALPNGENNDVRASK